MKQLITNPNYYLQYIFLTTSLFPFPRIYLIQRPAKSQTTKMIVIKAAVCYMIPAIKMIYDSTLHRTYGVTRSRRGREHVEGHARCERNGTKKRRA